MCDVTLAGYRCVAMKIKELTSLILVAHASYFQNMKPRFPAKRRAS